MNTPSLPAERQITRQQAADIIGLSIHRVRQLYGTGRFTKYRNAQGHLRLDRTEVEDYRKQRETFRATAG